MAKRRSKPPKIQLSLSEDGEDSSPRSSPTSPLENRKSAGNYFSKSAESSPRDPRYRCKSDSFQSRVNLQEKVKVYSYKYIVFLGKWFIAHFITGKCVVFTIINYLFILNFVNSLLTLIAGNIVLKLFMCEYFFRNKESSEWFGSINQKPIALLALCGLKEKDIFNHPSDHSRRKRDLAY